VVFIFSSIRSITGSICNYRHYQPIVDIGELDAVACAIGRPHHTHQQYHPKQRVIILQPASAISGNVLLEREGVRIVLIVGFGGRLIRVLGRRLIATYRGDLRFGQPWIK
jgi:hypothetical protein